MPLGLGREKDKKVANLSGLLDGYFSATGHHINEEKRWKVYLDSPCWPPLPGGVSNLENASAAGKATTLAARAVDGQRIDGAARPVAVMIEGSLESVEVTPALQKRIDRVKANCDAEIIK